MVFGSLVFGFLSFPVAFADDEDAGGIEEVIVTAERQASSIQDTAEKSLPKMSWLIFIVFSPASIEKDIFA